MIARAVIGANFGDEGKGLVTDYLCSQGAGIVVRFNGGSQAGHTVVTPDKERHVFHHFGSGTLLDVPTFLSQFFICNPLSFARELNELRELGFHPKVYAHPDCLITTYIDMAINQFKEQKRGDKRHGSCGMGIHETIQRSKVPELKITMSDLWNADSSLASRLEEISNKWCSYRIGLGMVAPTAIPEFVKACNYFANYVEPIGIAQCKDPVFEGSQGLQLDQDNKQFWPHVTHSHTGMKNVGILCQQAGISDVEIYYVSRTYLTRHGAGELPGEDEAMSFGDDTNLHNEFQGPLRFAKLDYHDMCKRVFDDSSKHSGLSVQSKVVLTHCDQLDAPIKANLYSYGPCRKDVTAKYSSRPLIEV